MESLQGKPKFADIVEELIEYLRGAELIIHNAPFDVGFLDHEFQLAGKRYNNIDHHCTVLDTLVLARGLHPGQRNSLDALCARYSVDNSNREWHGALLDSELLAQVYLLMTGGQTQLFGADESMDTQSTAEAIERVDPSRKPLPVIAPSADELERHQAFMDQL